MQSPKSSPRGSPRGSPRKPPTSSGFSPKFTRSSSLMSAGGGSRTFKRSNSSSSVSSRSTTRKSPARPLRKLSSSVSTLDGIYNTYHSENRKTPTRTRPPPLAALPIKPTKTMTKEEQAVFKQFTALPHHSQKKLAAKFASFVTEPIKVTIIKPANTNLGITCALRSLKLMDVSQNSPAADAGLAEYLGKVITHINTEAVKTVADIREAARNQTKVRVTFNMHSDDGNILDSSDEDWAATEGSSADIACTPKSPRITGVGRHLIANFEVNHEDLEVFWSKEIGQGAFSNVYAGCYAGATDVAVKIQKKTEKGSAEEEQEFMEELNVMTKLRHPNILLLIGASFEQKNLMLVTELCDPANLRDIIRSYERKPVEWTSKLDWCTQICRGMAYLHLKGIHHRDLKPSNIFVSQGGVLKIADFGLSCVGSSVVTGAPRRDPVTGARNDGDEDLAKIPGTFSFIAPEIWAEEAYTPAADVYSFGICVLEMITTYLPFEGATTAEVSWGIMTGRARPCLPASLPIPSSLRDIVNRMLCFTPTSRPTCSSLAVLFRREACLDYADTLCPSLDEFCPEELTRASPPDPKCASWS
eukprot:TRINITY_DN13712_c0_g1_i1.p1 TRINITY_DN13712_c0_g1~~TRINITY_DN13712_c0_g1_i1.p1  ORF type:complete len:594 (+),score=73.53 TRINITY_DN13712_c0_g1_i1:27-1784(+)